MTSLAALHRRWRWTIRATQLPEEVQPGPEVGGEMCEDVQPHPEAEDQPWQLRIFPSQPDDGLPYPRIGIQKPHAEASIFRSGVRREEVVAQTKEKGFYMVPMGTMVVRGDRAPWAGPPNGSPTEIPTMLAGGAGPVTVPWAPSEGGQNVPPGFGPWGGSGP